MEPNREACLTGCPVEDRGGGVQIDLDSVLSAEQLADRLANLAGGLEFVLGCAVVHLCETMGKEPVLKSPRVGELVLPVFEIGGVDEVADQLQM